MEYKNNVNQHGVDDEMHQENDYIDDGIALDTNSPSYRAIGPECIGHNNVVLVFLFDCDLQLAKMLHSLDIRFNSKFFIALNIERTTFYYENCRVFLVAVACVRVYAPGNVTKARRR